MGIRKFDWRRQRMERRYDTSCHSRLRQQFPAFGTNLVCPVNFAAAALPAAYEDPPHNAGSQPYKTRCLKVRVIYPPVPCVNCWCSVATACREISNVASQHPSDPLGLVADRCPLELSSEPPRQTRAASTHTPACGGTEVTITLTLARRIERFLGLRAH